MTIPTMRARQTSPSDNFCPAIPFIEIHTPLTRICRGGRWYAHLNALPEKERVAKSMKLFDLMRSVME